MRSKIRGSGYQFLAVDGLHGSWLEQTTREVEPVSDILSVRI